MEIIAIMMFICGGAVYSWYKSGEVRPGGDQGDTLPAKRGELVRVSRVEAVHADGLTGDIDSGGPAWATCGIRIRMAGAKIPQGRTSAEKWLCEILRGQLAEIVQAAKVVHISGINRESDGSLSADILIDGRQLTPKRYEPPPDEPVRRPQEQPSFPSFAGYPGQGYGPQGIAVHGQGYPQGLNGNGYRPQGLPVGPSFQGQGYQGGGFRQ